MLRVEGEGVWVVSQHRIDVDAALRGWSEIHFTELDTLEKARDFLRPWMKAENPGHHSGDPEAAMKELRERKQKEVRRLVKIAKDTGSTVPFDLRTLIEAGVGTDTIRQVIRPVEQRG
jgi:hypothetical protein